MTRLWPLIATLVLAPVCAGTGFVFDTTGASIGPMAVRLLAAMRSGDSRFAAESHDATSAVQQLQFLR